MLQCKNNRLLWAILFSLLFSANLYANSIDLNAKLDLLVKACPNALSHVKGNALYFNNGLPPIQIDGGPK